MPDKLPDFKENDNIICIKSDGCHHRFTVGKTYRVYISNGIPAIDGDDVHSIMANHHLIRPYFQKVARRKLPDWF